MGSDALCEANALDNGSCDFAAVRTYIAKDQEFSEKDTDYKVKILCHMLRLGFSLGDTFAAGFDTVDCSDAKRETSRGEVCVDVGDSFDDNACIAAGELASPSTTVRSTTAPLTSTGTTASVSASNFQTTLATTEAAAGASSYFKEHHVALVASITSVMVAVVLATAWFVVHRKSADDKPAAAGGVHAFENPMYNFDSPSRLESTVDDEGGAGATATGGYMDLKVGGESNAANANGGYMDVKVGGAGATATTGYMEVNAASASYIEVEDEEEI